MDNKYLSKCKLIKCKQLDNGIEVYVYYAEDSLFMYTYNVIENENGIFVYLFEMCWKDYEEDKIGNSHEYLQELAREMYDNHIRIKGHL